MGWVTQGTIGSVLNIDTYVYSSIRGTLDSIKDILIKGRISDSYALLRKYHESVIINVYSNLYLEDNFSIENFVVEKLTIGCTARNNYQNIVLCLAIFANQKI